MNTYAKLAVAAAAAIVVAVAGYSFLPKSGPGAAAPTQAPSPSPAATAVAPSATVHPSSAAIAEIPGEVQPLAPGRYRLHLSETMSVVADVPAGWDGGGALLWASGTASGAPSGIAIVFAIPTKGLFSDPCHWNVDGSGNADQPGDVVVGPAVVDLVWALRTNTSYVSNTPAYVAFGPYAATRLELTFPRTLDPSTCDREASDDRGTYRVMPETIYAQGPANIWRLSIVDVAGTRVVAIMEYFPGTPPAKVAEAQAIVDSFTFDQ